MDTTRFFQDNMKVLVLVAGLVILTIGAAIFLLRPAPTEEAVQAMYVSANSLAAQKDRQAAIDQYTQVLHADPTHFDAFYNRGVMRSQMGDKPGALADYSEAIRIKPDMLSARVNRGSLYRKMGNLNASLEDLDAAVKVDPKHKLVRYHRGMTQLELGNYDDAAKEFDTAAKIDPKFTDALAERERAKALSAFKRRDQAGLDAALVGIQRLADANPNPNSNLKKVAAQPGLWLMAHIPNETLCSDMTISENKACPGKMRVGPTGYIKDLVNSFSQNEAESPMPLNQASPAPAADAPTTATP